MNDFITDEMLEIYSLDWFAVDQAGFIGHFVNAGIGFMPMSARASDSDRISVLHYFKKMKPRATSLHVELRPPDVSESDFYACFERMSKRGLYSYCFPIDIKNATEYNLVTKPSKPLILTEIPLVISNIISKTRLSCNLQDCIKIEERHFVI